MFTNETTKPNEGETRQDEGGEMQITNEMVERACLAYVASARHHFDGDVPDTTHMRAALTAALKGKK